MSTRASSTSLYSSRLHLREEGRSRGGGVPTAVALPGARNRAWLDRLQGFEGDGREKERESGCWHGWR
ncbi:unnamed protein product [Mycena citricolor]|uniref:Uncharacterized protein n=1 Tax=Mycena citricolor TaxID=2018698 RepID=A0AAD2JWV2_9AGAR|nr:unnamed protein product [Mycena citricolor]